MNYSDLSGLLITIGTIVLVYPITVIVFEFDILLGLFRYTLAVGSALFGAGIGFAVGQVVYRKEKGGKDDG
jgi:hypothetical protein